MNLVTFWGEIKIASESRVKLKIKNRVREVLVISRTVFVEQ